MGTTIATVVPASLLGGGLVGFIQASAGPATDTHVWSWTRQSALAAVGFWLMALALLYAFGMFPPTDPRVSVASGALGGLAYGLLTGPTLPSAAPAWRTTLVPE